MKAPIPENEAERLKNLRSYQILDTPSQQEYDDITLLASQICGTPIALISLVDEERQWFKSKIGLEADETPREHSFCAHALNSATLEVFVVKDATRDERFADNPMVTEEPQIRFYAGAPLVTSSNFAIGTLCVIDRHPRRLSQKQLEALQALARQIATRMELQRTSLLLQKANEELQNLSLTDDLTGLNNRRGFLLHSEQQLKLFRSRQTDRGMWLLMADVDYLKQINDTLGHQEGSEAIINTGKILKKSFRDSDIVARLGGDEFVVLIINTLDEVKEKIAARVEQNLAAHNAGSGKPYALSVSYGLVQINFGNADSIEELMRLSDDEMYEHKRSRR